MTVYELNNIEFKKEGKNINLVLKAINDIAKKGRGMAILFLPDEEDLYNSATFVYDEEYSYCNWENCIKITTKVKPLNTMLIYFNGEIDSVIPYGYLDIKMNNDKQWTYSKIITDIISGRKVSLRVHDNDIDLRVNMSSFIFAEYDKESEQNVIEFRYNDDDIYSIEIKDTDIVSEDIVKLTKCKLPIE